MPQPALSSVAQQMYDQLAPLAYAEESLDYPLAHFCEAIARNAQEIEDFARDSDDGPGWSTLTDIERAPGKVMPWLAQFVGVDIPERLSVVQWLNEVTNPNFETGVTPWIAIGGGANAVARVQSNAHTGQYSLEVTQGAGGSNSAAWLASVATMNQGQHVLIGFWVTRPAGWTGGNVVPNYQGQIDGAVQVEALSTPDTPGTDFCYLIVRKDLGPDNDTFGLAGGSNIPATGQKWYLDDAMVVFGELEELQALAASRPVIDGDQPNGRWQGARGNSKSEITREESDDEYAVRLKPLILARTGWERGTPEAMRAAAGLYLTGTKAVAFRERTPTPYSLQVRSLASETPNEALVRRELLKVKPAGIVLDYDSIPGQDWLNVETTYANWAAVEATGQTWGQLKADF